MSIEKLTLIFGVGTVSIEARGTGGNGGDGETYRGELLAALSQAEEKHHAGGLLIRAKHLGDVGALKSLINMYPLRAVMAVAGMLQDPGAMLDLYKRHNPYGRREARRARELELKGESDRAAHIRELIAQRCIRDTEGGRCPACSGTGELTKPKPHTCPHCHGGYVASPEMMTAAERMAEKELQRELVDATTEFYRHMKQAKSA